MRPVALPSMPLWLKGAVRSLSQPAAPVYRRRRLMAVGVLAITIVLLGALCLAGLSRRTAAVGASPSDSAQSAGPSLHRMQVPRSRSSLHGRAMGENDLKASDFGAKTLDWRASSGGSHPNLGAYGGVSVDVSIGRQRVYVRSHGVTIYMMIASTGMNDSTPRGDFTVSGRGPHFYNPGDSMGADYWVSFLNDEYLFHSVPTGNDQGDYIESEARKLGEPASHGCVRLTVADARWLYEQLPDGTPVHIE